MAGLEIITTADGSHTLRNNELDETYHSIHGAVQESMHVFIRNGLDFFCNSNMRETISILEIGFGTGLNALLASQYALQKKVGVSYTTLEPFPLPRDVWSKLNYGDNDRRHFEMIHETSWNVLQSVSTNFSILKLKVSLQEAELTEKHDVIFFDAFASSVQPELWVFDSLKKVTGAMKGNGVFVTYAAKGQLKRDLKTLGLTVETLPGPPGKTEMVRATKPLVGN